MIQVKVDASYRVYRKYTGEGRDNPTLIITMTLFFYSATSRCLLSRVGEGWMDTRNGGSPPWPELFEWCDQFLLNTSPNTSPKTSPNIRLTLALTPLNKLLCLHRGGAYLCNIVCVFVNDVYPVTDLGSSLLCFVWERIGGFRHFGISWYLALWTSRLNI